ncbi:sugar ABC transporter substrate-binding protein [Pseudokineococcus marinus]|uniref:Sugar ABC transporter substrate-binding protein n=1 Tax=Pseudokineococcus marinus TaxID=351215 RepID=A0A849BMQ8_9ACTN|nr:sugar ABC transporter substrate-binding protein [Pseudokineococcus marinus]NNH22665.1 sugar ABC transporter substrate-binding protein [Pseudokineococcus marinus]
MDGETVEMGTWIGGEADQAQWSAYVDAGEAADPEVSVSFSGPPIGDFYTKLPTVLRGSNAPCIVTLQNGQVGPYVSGLEPLEQYAEEAGVDFGDYNSAMIEQLSVDGQVYAIPYDAAPAVVYYNKEMFEAAGVPEPSIDWTTEDFLAAARATTRDGVWGFALGQGITPVTSLMSANGENYVSEDGVADLDDPNLVSRFQWYVDLATEEGVAKPLEASGGSFPDIDAFSTGQAAMSMNGLWDLPNEQEKLGEDVVGVATVPSDDGGSMGYVGGTGFAMTKSCGDKEAAFAAIKAITSAEAMQSVARSRATVVARPDSFDAWAETIGSQQTADVVRQLTENSFTTPTPSELSQLNTLITQYETNAFSGESSAQEVLQQVASALNQ